MILARGELEQIDCDLAEDGKTLIAIGFTADPDDTAVASAPLDPTASFDDQASALRLRLELANAMVRGLRAFAVERGLKMEATPCGTRSTRRGRTMPVTVVKG